MNLKPCVFFLLLILTWPPVYAEDTVRADHESVELQINALGEVRVKHIIKDSGNSQQLKLVDGTLGDISVRDARGNEVAFTASDDGMHILLPPSDEDTVVEYGLLDGLVQKDRVWTMDFSYGETTSVLIPDGVDLIFVNGKPVYMGEKNGVKCHGCYMLLEYVVDEPRTLETVQWGEDEFLVEIRTLSDVDRFEFDQPSKSIRFDVGDGQKFVTAIIPTELLGDPYSVFLDSEKIYFHEYINNGTHVWLNTKPDSGGQIEIIGTTVIPEFSMMIPLIAGFVLIVMISRFRMAIPR